MVPEQRMAKSLLAQTMKRILSQRPLSKISVADLVEECGLHRNSFYYHFRDKYDLVNWIFQTEFDVEIASEKIDDPWRLLERVLQFFYQDQAFYANALRETGQNTFAEYFSELTKTTLIQQKGTLFEDDEYRDFYAAFFLDAFIATVSRWLQQGTPLSPDRLSDLMKKALTGAAVKTQRQE